MQFLRPKECFYQIILSFILLYSISSASSYAEERPDFYLGSCEDLKAPEGTHFDDIPSWELREGLPQFCRVRGQIEGRTRFEMRLPKDWNGRFVMAGCGGFCGVLNPDKSGHSNSINEALKKGYAAISHDGGHTAQSWQTDWAYNDPEALEIWAHKILPLVTGVGSYLVESLYGKPARYKYFSGCSNGGRLGMMAAQKYPDLFDGIAAGGSIFSMSQIAGLWGNWMIGRTVGDSRKAFDRRKNPLIKSAVMQHCDALDGRTDGVISDPRQCQFSFSKLQCDDLSSDQNRCLTTDEVAMLDELYGGVKNSKGAIVSPGLSFGSEHYTDIWLFGSQDKPAWGFAASTGYRNLLTNEVYGRDEPVSRSTDGMLDLIERSSLPALTDAVQADLSRGIKSDTKLFIYQGWSDPLIIPTPIVNYYERAIIENGGLKRLKDHARLFMVPGLGHCWERPADSPAEFDPLEIVAQWVESGDAPESVNATQLDSRQEVLRTRPICSYPKVAVLLNEKDPDEASSWQCTEQTNISQQNLSTNTGKGE